MEPSKEDLLFSDGLPM